MINRVKEMKRKICLAVACVLFICSGGAPARAEDTDEGILNVLLCGVDRGDSGARAGAILIMTADTVRGGIRLTSVSGALCPEAGEKCLSEMYDSGGAEGLARTLSSLLGVPIKRYVTVDRAGFSAAVDACGGVEIDLRADEALSLSEMSGEDVQPGLRTLDGEQALLYVRLRGDDPGNRRQRIFLSAMAEKAMRLPDFGALLDLAEQLLPYMTANLPAMDLISVVIAALMGEEGSMETCTLPGDGEYALSGGVMTLTDREGMAERFRNFAYRGMQGR